MQRNFEEMKIEKEATDKKVEGFDEKVYFEPFHNLSGNTV